MIMKRLFLNYVSNIINQVISLINNGIDVNKYLTSVSLNEYELFLLVSNFDENNISLISKLFKKHYENCESVSWKKLHISEFAQKIGLTYETYMFLGKVYGKYVLNITDIDELVRHKQIGSTAPASKFVNILYQILDETDDTAIFSLFADNHIVKETIMRFIYSKARNFTKEEQTKYEHNLMTKYNNYINSKKKVLHKNIPVQAYYDYLNSSLELKEFCQENNYAVTSFKDSLVNLEDKELIQRVKDKLIQENETKLLAKQEKDANNLYFESQVKLIISYIDNGLTFNNFTKDFDLLDLFVLFNGINPYKPFYPFLNDEDNTKIKIFFTPFYNAEHLNRESIVNGYYEVNCLNDEHGNPIMHSGRVITKDELAYIINFMNEYNVPMLDVLFNIALKRYLNNTLDIYKTSEPTLK